MMPEDSAYGTWPLSGEIDIMESRGNARGYPGHGRELFVSTLHWGQDLTYFVIFSMILLTSEKVLQFRTTPSGEQHTRARSSVVIFQMASIPMVLNGQRTISTLISIILYNRSSMLISNDW
jgi:hypothetical protein